MKERPYQTAAVEAVFKEWEDKRSTMVVMPTGCGKTHVFCSIIKRLMPKRSMVIAHREELIFQAREKLASVAGIHCEIEKAELAASSNLWNRAPVVVASVQTLISMNFDKKRMHRFDPMDFGALFVDENHHSTADSYREIIKHFMDGNPNLKLFGCTATPDRADEEALGQVYESVAFDYEIIDAIEDGWLVPIEQQLVQTEVDFSGIRTTAGDLNGADLAAVMEAEHNLQGVAGAALQIVGNRRCLVFASSVKHAEMLSSIFNRHRQDMSDWVSAKTPKDERRRILDRFAAGDLQVVCNCGCLTEGFDNPGIEVIIMARPTKSRALYAQMVGRSTRPLPGVVDGLGHADARKMNIAASAKPRCLIVDFTGNSGRHRLVTTADILGGNMSEEAITRAVEQAKRKGGPVRMVEILADEAKKMAEEEEERRRLHAARTARLVAKVKFTSTVIDPFAALGMRPVKERGWDAGRQLSEKQKSLMMKQGLNPESYSYSQGKAILNEMFRRWSSKLCTMKQAHVIRRYRPNYDTRNLTMDGASKIIDGIAAERGWKGKNDTRQKVS
jgi:superfamily II DNA or RNA helicase